MTLSAEEDYATCILWHPYRWCWWCGRGPQAAPEGWFAPWLIERAHIVSNPRRCDSRAVVALCTLCHKRSHGIDIQSSAVVIDPPSLAAMLWLKRRFDASRYDRQFLAKCIIGRLPRAAAPPESVRTEYSSRRGGYPDGRLG